MNEFDDVGIDKTSGAFRALVGTPIWKDEVLQSLARITSVTADTTLGIQHAGLILVDTTSGNVTLTLPSAVTAKDFSFTVKRTTAGVNSLTVTGATGNIDGAASVSMATQYDYFTFRSDGTNFWKV